MFYLFWNFIYLLKYSWFTIVVKFQYTAKRFSFISICMYICVCIYISFQILGSSLVVWQVGLGTVTVVAWVQPLAAELISHNLWGQKKKSPQNNPLKQIVIHYRLLQDTEDNSVCSTACPCWLSVLYLVLCVCGSQTPNLSPSFSLWKSWICFQIFYFFMTDSW